MNTLAARLDSAIRARVPSLEGVSIGREDDRTTWVAHIVNATDADRARAAEVIRTYVDVEPPAPIVDALDVTAALATLLAEVEALKRDNQQLKSDLAEALE